MGLTSSGTVVMLCLLTALLPLAVLLLWNRLRGNPALRAGQRLGLVVAAQLTAVLLVFVVVNDQYLFFQSWSELLGSSTTAVIVPGDLPGAGGAAAGTVRTAATAGTISGPGTHRAGTGRVIDETVTGSGTGITAEVIVHLPAEYDQVRYAHTDFPVLEVLGGYRGHPRGVLNAFHLLGALRAAARSGTLGPVITVIPTVNVALPRDTECTDVPGGPKAESWLAGDVHSLVLRQFRAQRTPGAWAVMGFSTGGYCAAKLAVHHPDLFRTSVVLGGYFTALRDHTTGDLWGGSKSLREENDLLWWEQHRPLPDISMLLFTTRTDRSSYPTTEEFLARLRPPLHASLILVATGGHNVGPMRAALPQMLAWVGQHLPLPTSNGPGQRVMTRQRAALTAAGQTRSHQGVATRALAPGPGGVGAKAA